MNVRKIVTNLDDDELVVGIYRQFALAFFWHWLGAILFLLSPFFLLYPLLRFHGWGSGILTGLFFIGFFWLGRTWRIWYYSIMVSTDKRLVIIDQKGTFDRQVSQVSLDKINDISYRKKGLIQTIFNIGTLYIQISGALERTEIYNLLDPARCQKELFALKGEYHHQGAEFTEADLMSIIREIRSRVGEDRWREIQEGEWSLKKELIEEVGSEDSKKARAIEQFFQK